MASSVSGPEPPSLLGSVTQLVDDDALIAPIDVVWNAQSDTGIEPSCPDDASAARPGARFASFS